VILPRPLELSTEGVEEPPPLVDDVDDYDPEVSVCVCVGGGGYVCLCVHSGIV
jgi:hypothetical protein